MIRPAGRVKMFSKLTDGVGSGQGGIETPCDVGQLGSVQVVFKSHGTGQVIAVTAHATIEVYRFFF